MPSLRVLAQCCLVAVLAAVPLLGWAQGEAKRADRVYLRELEGIWINKSYLDGLSKSRMPHQTAKKTRLVVIRIQREGRSYPIVVTDFADKASIQTVLDVEPGGKPGLYRLVLGPDDRPISSGDVKYLWFRGTRNAAGKFDSLELSEPVLMKGKWAEYVSLGNDLAVRMNRAVLAGSYTDAKGATWEFSEQGQATWPDRTFAFEVSLNDPGAQCEYFEAEEAAAGKVPYGYAWRGGKLQIFKATRTGKKVRCDPRPFAVLQQR
jgi:hypothetical protein